MTFRNQTLTHVRVFSDLENRIKNSIESRSIPDLGLGGIRTRRKGIQDSTVTHDLRGPQTEDSNLIGGLNFPDPDPVENANTMKALRKATIRSNFEPPELDIDAAESNGKNSSLKSAGKHGIIDLDAVEVSESDSAGSGVNITTEQKQSEKYMRGSDNANSKNSSCLTSQGGRMRKEVYERKRLVRSIVKIFVLYMTW